MHGYDAKEVFIFTPTENSTLRRMVGLWLHGYIFLNSCKELYNNFSMQACNYALILLIIQ